MQEYPFECRRLLSDRNTARFWTRVVRRPDEAREDTASLKSSTTESDQVSPGPLYSFDFLRISMMRR